MRGICQEWGHTEKPWGRVKARSSREEAKHLDTQVQSPAWESQAS